MASPEIMQESLLQTVHQTERRLTTLRIDGKNDIFEGCELERNLRAVYMRAVHQRQKAVLLSDRHLQGEAALIVRQMEYSSSAPSHAVAGWLLRLISASTSWLKGLKERVAMVKTNVESEGVLVHGTTTVLPLALHEIESNGQGRVLPVSHGPLLGPSNDNVVTPAVVCSPFHGWPVDNTDLFETLCLDHDAVSRPLYNNLLIPGTTATPIHEEPPDHNQLHNGAVRAQPLAKTILSRSLPAESMAGRQPTAPAAESMRPPYFHNGANAYCRLARDLARFITATVSNNNPNSTCRVMKRFSTRRAGSSLMSM